MLIFLYLRIVILFHLNQGSLRRRFGVALMWFNSLQHATNAHMDKVFLIVRKSITEFEDGIHQAVKDVEDEPPTLPSTAHPCNGRQATVEDEEGEEDEHPSNIDPSEGNRKRPRLSPEPPFPEPPPRTRPSDYLRSRCPLCFGGKQRTELKG